MKQARREEQARRRASLIFQVQSGTMTATEAAKALGVSRKTYYEWERRALEGMLEATQDRPLGRPAKPSNPEEEQLRNRVAELEEEVEHLRTTLHVRTAMENLTKETQEESPSKSRGSKKKRGASGAGNTEHGD